MPANGFNYQVEKPAEVFFMPLVNQEPPNSLARKTKTLLSKSDLLSVLRPQKLVAIKQHLTHQYTGFFPGQLAVIKTCRTGRSVITALITITGSDVDGWIVSCLGLLDFFAP